MDLFLQLLAFVGVPGGLLALSLVLRSRERIRLLDVVRSAAEQGHPLPADVVGMLRRRSWAAIPGRDYRRGVVLVAWAAAIALTGFAAYVSAASFEAEGAVAIGISIAALGALPGCIGAALIVLSRAARTTRVD
jgi:hypothetical protein